MLLKILLMATVSLVFLIRPFEGLCIIAFFTPLELAFPITENFTAVRLLGGVLFVSWFINASLKREQIYFPRIIILIFIFVLWGLLSILWAEYKNLVLERTMIFVRFAGLLFLVQQLVKTERQLHFFILSNVAGAIIVGMIGLYQFWLNPYQRVTGLGESGGAYTAHFGYSLLLAILYFLIRLLYNSRHYFRGILFLVGLGTLLVSALATYTRSLMLGLIASGLFLFLHSLKNRDYFNLAKIIIIFSIVFVMVQLVFPTYLTNRLRTVWNLEDRGSGRLDIWSVYLINVIKNPLSGIVGTGLSNSYPHYGLFLDRAREYGVYPEFYVALQSEMDTHNIYLQVLVELGFAGFALFLFIILTLSKQFYNSFRFVRQYSLTWQIGLVIALEFIAILTGGTFLPMLNRKYFWFAISHVIAYIRIVGNSKIVNNENDNIGQH